MRTRNGSHFNVRLYTIYNSMELRHLHANSKQLRMARISTIHNLLSLALKSACSVDPVQVRGWKRSDESGYPVVDFRDGQSSFTPYDHPGRASHVRRSPVVGSSVRRLVGQ